MRRVVLLALLALLVPTAALANSVNFHLVGGTLNVTPTSATLDANIIGFNLCGDVPPCGQLHLVAGTATLSFPSFNTTANQSNFGSGGSITLSDGGYVFSGTFTKGTWQVTQSGTKTEYQFTGVATGLLTLNGASVPTTLTFTSGQTVLSRCIGGKCPFDSGDVSVTTVPEPGTLSLLGTGLIGLAGMVRRRFHRAA